MERRIEAVLASVATDRLDRLNALANKLDPAAAARIDAGRLAAIMQRADRLDPLAVAMAAARQRTTAVLAREPWSDPASRDQREVAHAAKDVIDITVARATAAAAEAAARQRQAADRVGILDRIAMMFGMETNAILAEHAAAANADRLRLEADTQAGSHDRRLNQVDIDAPGMVRRREDERSRWLESREVRTAVREAYGNDLVEAAIADGMLGIKVLAERDLAAARELLLREEERRAAELRLSRDLWALLPVGKSSGELFFVSENRAVV